jgi:hypothetical protein
LQKLQIVDQEVFNPIEVLANLVYLTRKNAADKTKVLLYMSMADDAILSLLGAVRRLDSL